MNKVVVVLTASTVVLTATTLYYAHALGELRSRDWPAARAAASPAASPAITLPVAAAAEPSPAAAVSAAAIPASPSPTSSHAPFDPYARQRARNATPAREFLVRYDDPKIRETMALVDTASRRRRLQKVANTLQLSEEQFDAVVKLQVDERMDNRARAARCVLDAGCMAPPPIPAELQERRRAITESIGEKKLARLRAEDRRGPEADMVAKLQSRLPPELRLKPAELETLADAMGEEIQQMRKELRTGDNQVSAYGGYGVVPYVKGVATLEENMVFARDSARRLNDRAATLLTGKRLETFNTLQADGVVMFREFIRRQISLRAAGYEGS
jgi:hypothetical protein